MSMVSPASDRSDIDLEAPLPAAEKEALALGDNLRSARESAGLTLQEIAAETRIPVYHLRALECGNLAAVPGGLYRRAELRAFARAVRLDENLALSHLERALQPVPEKVVRNSPTAPMTLTWLGGVLRIAIVAVVAAVGVWVFISWARTEVVRTDTDTLERSNVPPRQMEQPQQAEPSQQFVSDLPIATTGMGSHEAPEDGSAITATELLITTEPPGARVTVDGLGYGDTPIAVRYLPPGAKRVRVTKAGYRGEERIAQVVADRRAALHIPLRITP